MIYRFLFIIIVLQACRAKDNSENKGAPMPLTGIDQTITEQEQYTEVGLTKLSAYNYFEHPLSDLTPSKNVFPYDINSGLFSDYALKKRFIYLPEGKTINYREKEVLDFPVGTVLIKNFYYEEGQISPSQRKIMETRLLVHQESGWAGLPYIWNEKQTEAFLEITGGQIPITLAHNQQIAYTIPDMNQCKSCHDRDGKMIPIGPSIRQLNRKHEDISENINQLDQMQEMGWLDLPKDRTLPKLVVWNNASTGNLNERARAYLDVNCAHCHSDAGPAKNSGLDLSIFEEDDYHLGVNKKPIAAGRGSGKLKYGIVPGQPDASILLHRMIINEPGTMMPEIGRSIVHDEGVELIREWINKM